jgi:hypothetical protein
MKKFLILAAVSVSMLLGSGCASWTPETKAKFEIVVEQALTVGVPKAQELVNREIAAGDLTQKQGDLIMKLVTAYAAKVQANLNK